MAHLQYDAAHLQYNAAHYEMLDIKGGKLPMRCSTEDRCFAPITRHNTCRKLNSNGHKMPFSIWHGAKNNDNNLISE